MENRSLVRGAFVAACLVLLCFASTAQANPITLTAITTPFPSPIGIDHYEPLNRLVMSVNYSSGLPHNFRLVAANGTQSVFSGISGLTDEVKIATARAVSGSFPSGTVFSGTGVNGQILRLNPNGTFHSFINLPGGDGLMRGSLYVDRTGIYGGDLIAVTTGGQVWRIPDVGAPTMLADVNTHLEGLVTVPNNPAQYGPLAGKIIAGAEGSGRLYVFDNTGSLGFTNPGVNIEDIDLITGTENFYGVNFGTGQLLGAPASEFAALAGQILLTQEFHAGSGLYALSWDGSKFVTTQLGLTAGSFNPGQWEHVTFSPAGIVQIPPVPEPASLAMVLVAAVLFVRFLRR